MTHSSQLIAHSSLFDGLTADQLEAVARQMKPRRFREGEVICRENEPGNSLFVIQDGLALVLVSQPASGSSEAVARLRRGDVVGEMSLVTGEPRSATVMAAVPTSVLELGQEDFAGILARYPAVLMNLNRILSRRLARTNVRQADRRRGEAVALVLGPRTGSAAPRLLAATRAASPRSVASLDVRPYSYAQTFSLGPTGDDRPDQYSLETALALLDDLLSEHGTVVIVADVDQQNVSFLLEHVDRVVVVAAEPEVERLLAMRVAGRSRQDPGAVPFQGSFDLDGRIEVVLVSDEQAGRGQPPAPPSTVEDVPVIRMVNPSSPRDVAWLGRHLSRTKLGLALGAGGAKGYAHVGALYALEGAGYTIDCVAGSSIGAVVGSWLALGHRAAEIDALMREAFSPDNVAAMFKLSMSGMSSGLETMTRVFQETTGGRSFADLTLPLVAMSVDLNTRQPAPIREGTLWEALVAATALAGMFPPHMRGDQRLVDGLALVPVPTGAAIEAGADITVSVNLMSRETLPAWPGEAPPQPAPARAGSRMLDTLLEVMDLAQLDSSVRHAALADVVVTPRFGPGSWRDFHLADLFLAAGRAAAEEQLATLHSLARPRSSNLYSKGEVHDTGAAVHV